MYFFSTYFTLWEALKIVSSLLRQTIRLFCYYICILRFFHAPFLRTHAGNIKRKILHLSLNQIHADMVFVFLDYFT